MIKDFFKLAVQNILHRKLRAWLTMIGIFIGITAVVAIISLGQGMQVAVNEQFEALGVDKIWVMPGEGGFSTGVTSVILDKNDKRVLENVIGVDTIVGLTYTNAEVEFKDEVNFGLLMATTTQEEELDVLNSMYVDDPVVGRQLRRGDVFKAMVGWDYSQDKRVFDRAVSLGDKILINGVDFDVIGFNKQLGNSADDQTIIITEEAYERLFNEKLEDEYKYLIIKILQGQDGSKLAERLRRALRDHRNVDEGDEDFHLETTEEFMESFNAILSIINAVIVGIAAISLIIGGIGIMNTMYTAVVERTQEIGVMKAIGARNKTIMLIFLIESGVLGFIGGIIGVVFGLGISKMVEVVGAVALGSPYIRAWWSWELIVGALLFSFLIGAVSGVAPAYQASKQKPVDSLRYE